ncbi:MAG: response regulator [Candidatus Omnitrophota bacterium]
MEKTRILVVDDEQEICDVTRNFLAKRDYEVFTALNVQQAIDSLQKDKPHILLLDVRLGSESGMDILRKAKELDKNTKVIMVTALDDEETIRQSKSLGADDYITKPFTVDFLRDFVLQKITRLSRQMEAKNG